MSLLALVLVFLNRGSDGSLKRNAGAEETCTGCRGWRGGVVFGGVGRTRSESLDCFLVCGFFRCIFSIVFFSLMKSKLKSTFNCS